ncbi:MAG: hypothetical protein U5K56_03605 [Halioglobus sp.]|nr:hypothetical protein [Halioglobus sp.]
MLAIVPTFLPMIGPPARSSSAVEDELGQREGVGGAAVFLGKAHAQPAAFGHFGNELDACGCVDKDAAGDLFGHFAGNKLPDLVAKGDLFGAPVKVHSSLLGLA